MEPSELLRVLISVLERLEIPYFVTGSTASIAYGEPRFTNDIDVVAKLEPGHVRPFCASFSLPEYYVSEEAARDAAARHRQFNIIHPESGLKIDIIIAKGTDFDSSRFARVKRLKLSEDFHAVFASPEDVILKKLDFYREGKSEKHLRDIAGILKISGDLLDRAYIDSWVQRLGLADLWQEIARR